MCTEPTRYRAFFSFQHKSMAVGDGGKRIGNRKSESDVIESKDEMSDLEDDFSDPEDFEDDVTDEGSVI